MSVMHAPVCIRNFCMSVLFECLLQPSRVSAHCACAGSKNREFSFRHDWNSLISDDPSLLMKHYTEEYFPHADVYVRKILMCVYVYVLQIQQLCSYIIRVLAIIYVQQYKYILYVKSNVERMGI